MPCKSEEGIVVTILLPSKLLYVLKQSWYCRIENLELMLKYGVDVWKLQNRQMESVLSR
jgi:collagenase-like PrtC family protease